MALRRSNRSLNRLKNNSCKYPGFVANRLNNENPGSPEGILYNSSDSPLVVYDMLLRYKNESHEYHDVVYDLIGYDPEVHSDKDFGRLLVAWGLEHEKVDPDSASVSLSERIKKHVDFRFYVLS